MKIIFSNAIFDKSNKILFFIVISDNNPLRMFTTEKFDVRK